MKIKSGETYYLKQNFVLSEGKSGAVVLMAGSSIKLKDRRSSPNGLNYTFYTQTPGIVVYVNEKELDNLIGDFIAQSEAEYNLDELGKNAKKKA